MRDTTVAGRYAKALFLVTEKRRESERALADLKAAQDLLAPGTRFSSFLASPQVRLADKRQVLQAGFRGRALPSVGVFLDLLLRKKRLPVFGGVVGEFEALVEHSQGVRRAHVVSAVPLTHEETQRLQRELESFTRSKIKLTSEVDSRLLGGALVRLGDRVVDRSVRTLIDSIRRRLHEVSV